MRKNHYMTMNTIFVKVLCIFLLILMPLYFLGINIYNWGIRVIRNEISNSMTAQVTYYVNTFETDIQRISMLKYELINDTDLNKLAIIRKVMSHYERREAILALQRRLNAIKNSSVYIENVRVYIFDSKTSIDTGGLIEFDEGRISALLENAPDTVFPQNIYYIGNEPVMTAVFPICSIIREREPLYMIEILLSSSEIRNSITRFAGLEGSGTMLTVPENEFIVSSDEGYKTQELLRAIASIEGFKGKFIESIHINGIKHLAIYIFSDYLDMGFFKYIPESIVFDPLHEYRFWFLIFSVTAFFIIIIFSYFIFNTIHKPLTKLVKAFHLVEKGNFNVNIDYNDKSEFGYLFFRFNSLVDNLRILVDQVYMHKILMQKAQLKHLQSQINPHFLYNTFFILSTMVQTEQYDILTKFSRQLGEYFQYITRNYDEVQLKKEVDHALIYSNIQASRFSNRLKIDFDVLPREFEELHVPRLILQPLIENSFEHGVVNLRRNAYIKVSFITAEENLEIVVEDNGIGVDDEQRYKLIAAMNREQGEQEMTALANIHKRIRLKFGQTSGLVLSQSDLGGFKSTIIISYPEVDNKNV